MSKLPKLKVKKTPFGYSEEETYDFEQAKNFSYGQGSFVMVEGQVVNSYEELVQLAKQGNYKDSEFLEVILVPFMDVGG